MLDLTRENKVAGKEEWENKIVGVVNPMERHQGTIKSAEFIPGETGIFFSMDSRLVLIQMVISLYGKNFLTDSYFDLYILPSKMKLV